MHAPTRPRLVWTDPVSWQACKGAALAAIPPAPAGVKGQKYWASAASAKCVLMILAEAADESGFTFISVATIARRAEMSRRAAQGAMARLEAQGLIAREMRHRPGDGGRTSDGIQLRGIVPCAGSAPAPAQDLHGAAAKSARPPRKACTLTFSEPVNEPRERARPAGRLPEDWEAPSDAYEFGAELGLTSEQVEVETAKFRDWSAARGADSADWEASWRIWLRRAHDRAGPAGPRDRAGQLAKPFIQNPPWNGPDDLRAIVEQGFGDAQRARSFLAASCWIEAAREIVFSNGYALEQIAKAAGPRLTREGVSLKLQRQPDAACA